MHLQYLFLYSKLLLKSSNYKAMLCSTRHTCFRRCAAGAKGCVFLPNHMDPLVVTSFGGNTEVEFVFVCHPSGELLQAFSEQG